MLFTKLLLLVAAVATATPVATPVDDDPHGLKLTAAEKELMKDPSAWKFEEIAVDPTRALAARQMHLPQRFIYEFGSWGLFDCPQAIGFRRQIVAELTIRTTDGSNNGANVATWSSNENADEFRPRTEEPIDFDTTVIESTAYHFFCGTVLGSDPPIHCAYEMTVPLAARFEGDALPRGVDSGAPTLKEACVRLQGNGICPPEGFVQRDCSLRTWGIVVEQP